MEENTRYHPLDVRALTKGQTITVPELEKILGVAYPHPQWWSKVLVLKVKIDTGRSRLALPALTMTGRGYKDALHICTDEEAARYNRRRGKNLIKGFRKATRKNLAVDVSKLSPDDARAHELTIRKQAMTIAAIRSITHKAIQDERPERTTPKMVRAE